MHVCMAGHFSAVYHPRRRFPPMIDCNIHGQLCMKKYHQKGIKRWTHPGRKLRIHEDSISARVWQKTTRRYWYQVLAKMCFGHKPTVPYKFLSIWREKPTYRYRNMESPKPAHLKYWLSQQHISTCPTALPASGTSNHQQLFHAFQGILQALTQPMMPHLITHLILLWIHKSQWNSTRSFGCGSSFTASKSRFMEYSDTRFLMSTHAFQHMGPAYRHGYSNRKQCQPWIKKPWLLIFLPQIRDKFPLHLKYPPW